MTVADSLCAPPYLRKSLPDPVSLGYALSMGHLNHVGVDRHALNTQFLPHPPCSRIRRISESRYHASWSGVANHVGGAGLTSTGGSCGAYITCIQVLTLISPGSGPTFCHLPLRD
jgi:hypothetical protein